VRPSVIVANTHRGSRFTFSRDVHSALDRSFLCFTACTSLCAKACHTRAQLARRYIAQEASNVISEISDLGIKVVPPSLLLRRGLDVTSFRTAYFIFFAHLACYASLLRRGLDSLRRGLDVTSFRTAYFIFFAHLACYASLLRRGLDSLRRGLDVTFFRTAYFIFFAHLACYDVLRVSYLARPGENDECCVVGGPKSKGNSCKATPSYIISSY